jgi:hypothetical protein
LLALQHAAITRDEEGEHRRLVLHVSRQHPAPPPRLRPEVARSQRSRELPHDRQDASTPQQRALRVAEDRDFAAPKKRVGPYSAERTGEIAGS